MCRLASLRSRIYHRRSVEKLQRSMVCILAAPSLRPGKESETSSASPGVFPFRKKQKKSRVPVPAAPRSNKNATSGLQHASDLSGKHPKPKHEARTAADLGGAHHSSELFCFSSRPIVPQDGGMFLLGGQTVRLCCHWIIFTGQLRLERADGGKQNMHLL